jgi:ParB family chromosome partitioning protein
MVATAPIPQDIPLTRIRVVDRLRPVDPQRAEVLAARMAEEGQLQAVVVRRVRGGDEFELVIGAYRLTAAGLLGWTTIRAEVHELTPHQARLAEIDENLIRTELNALDRAIFLAERKRVWEQMHPETKHGGDRKSRQSGEGQDKSQSLRLDPQRRFSAEAAEKAGLSERTVQAAVALVEALAPEAIALVRGTPVADNAAQLKSLASEKPEDQVRMARAVATGEAGNIQAARVHLGLASPVERDADAETFAKLVDLWTRAGTKARRMFRDHIGKAGDKPAKA